MALVSVTALFTYSEWGKILCLVACEENSLVFCQINEETVLLPGLNLGFISLYFSLDGA
jgi:hypothetical protein